MKTMKKIAFYAILQGIVIFLITGLIIPISQRQISFSVAWPNILESLAAVMRFGTASLMKMLAPTLYDEEVKKEKAPTKKEAE